MGLKKVGHLERGGRGMEGERIISTVTTENANTFLKLELNQIQVQQNLKEHCYTEQSSKNKAFSYLAFKK